MAEKMRFSLPSRELIADCVETMISARCFDGMVSIPNCDKIVPGMLMAALRVDIPAIFVSGGAMAAGRTPDGEVVDLVSVFEGVGAARAGKISLARLKTLEDHGCPSCGSCSGMFTANSTKCPTERARTSKRGSRSHGVGMPLVEWTQRALCELPRALRPRRSPPARPRRSLVGPRRTNPDDFHELLMSSLRQLAPDMKVDLSPFKPRFRRLFRFMERAQVRLPTDAGVTHEDGNQLGLDERGDAGPR
jgi:hypothetical protein